MRGYHREPLGAAPGPSKRAIENRPAGVLAIVLVSRLTANCARVPPAPRDGSGIPAPRPVSLGSYREGDRTEDLLRRARALTDRCSLSGGLKLVPIGAWDEPGEGTVIEPQREWGFADLDAVRRVFSHERARHRDLVPRDLGLTVPRAP